MPDGPQGLTTLGRCLLAAGIAASACAVLLDERDLLRIGVLAAALPLLTALLTARTRVVVRGERTVDVVRLPVGGTVRVGLTLRTDGRLPVGGLELTDARPDALGGATSIATGRLRRGTPLEITYRLTPRLRGAHSIGPLTCRVSDALGLSGYPRTLAGRTRLTVLPRVTELSGLPPGFGRGAGEAGSTGLRRGPGERDALLRPYRTGDPIRTVHWRSTAHRDELMVRVEERPWHGGVNVLLDRRARAHHGHGEDASLEWAVALVASVCRHLIGTGRSVTVLGENGLTLAAGRDIEVVLDTLATVTTTNQPGLAAPPPDVDSGELLAVVGGTEPDELEALRRSWSGGRAHAVLLDVAAWHDLHRGLVLSRVPDVHGAARSLAGAGWTVVLGRPDRKPDDVWDELCRGLPLGAGAGP